MHTVLKRVVRQYKANRWVVGQLRPQVDLRPLEEMERVGNVSFRNQVAQAIIAKLSSPDVSTWTRLSRFGTSTS